MDSETQEVRIVKGISSHEVAVKEGKDFVRHLKNGVSPEDAAKAVGQPLSTLERNNFVKTLLVGLQMYDFSPEARRWITTTGFMKIFLDPNELTKDRIAAGKELRTDPELGLMQGQPAIEITISEELTKIKVGPSLWAKKEDTSEDS